MSLHKDLDGLRVQLPGDPAIYLMNGGMKRHIVNPDVYNALFINWDGVVQDINVSEITTGPQLGPNALLIRADGAPEIYLLDGPIKRHIANPDTMNRYYFDWNKVVVLPSAVVQAIPTGPQIIWPAP